MKPIFRSSLRTVPRLRNVGDGRYIGLGEDPDRMLIGRLWHRGGRELGGQRGRQATLDRVSYLTTAAAAHRSPHSNYGCMLHTSPFDASRSVTTGTFREFQLY